MSAEARLKELGITLPPPPKPVAAYVTAVRAGDLLFTAGNGPLVEGRPLCTGKVGAEVTVEQGYEAARVTTLNLLSTIREHLGSLDRVQRVVKVLGLVASAPGFTQQPKVMNGCSELLLEVFGDAGKHARSALGTSQLPFDIPVEIEMIVQVKPERLAAARPARRTASRRPAQRAAKAPSRRAAGGRRRSRAGGRARRRTR